MTKIKQFYRAGTLSEAFRIKCRASVVMNVGEAIDVGGEAEA